MLVLYEQEELKKRKRTGFLEPFGKKEETKPTATTTILNTLNSCMIAHQKEQSERLSQYTNSLSVRNRKLMAVI